MRRTKSNTILWVLVFSMIAVLAAAIILGVFSSWYTNWDVSTWFGRDKVEQTETPANKDDIVIIDDITNGAIPLPQRMAFAPLSVQTNDDGTETYEESSVTVTATVLPENATDKSIIWSVKWAEDISEFAAASNYIAIKEVDDTTVTVTCLQPFANEITLTATSNSNKEISASCSVYYVKRIKSFTSKYGSMSEFNSHVPSSEYVCPLGESQVMSFDYDYDIGCEGYTETYDSVTVAVRPVNTSENMTMTNVLKSQNGNVLGDTYTFDNLNFTYGGKGLNFGDDFCSTVFGAKAWGENRDQLLNYLTLANNGRYGTNHNVLTFEVTIKGTMGSVVSETFSCPVDISRYYTDVGSIQLGNDNITI